jgi:hypothetical protein
MPLYVASLTALLAALTLAGYGRMISNITTTVCATWTEPSTILQLKMCFLQPYKSIYTFSNNIIKLSFDSWEFLHFVLSSFRIFISLCLIELHAVKQFYFKMSGVFACSPILKLQMFWSKDIWQLVTPYEKKDIQILKSGSSSKNSQLSNSGLITLFGNI